MRILVCGGRDFNNALLLREHLIARIWPTGDYYDKNFTIIHGAAKGADTLAGEFAKNFGLKEEVYHANWDKHGKAAGHIRNELMLERGKPDVVIAFPGGRGTANMVSLAKKAGVKVIEVEYKQ